MSEKPSSAIDEKYTVLYPINAEQIINVLRYKSLFSHQRFKITNFSL